ncbi:MAG: N-acetylmuramoyl-L-alanine amidase [Hyphomicrobiales bacterium]|nr:N-acetylmuramoyl-L-alanine amidase [Hyphomicrobiales bacterium]
MLPIRGEARARPPAIVSRAQWNAKPALPGMTPQTIRGVILHNTGVRRNVGVSLEDKMRGLQSFSQRPAQVSAKHAKPTWPDVPYHYYVDFAGRIAEGRDVSFAGDTNTRYDTVGYIQIVLEGDFDKEAPEPAQLHALRQLLVWISVSQGLPTDAIGLHKDHAPTTCPGRHFLTEWPRLRDQIFRDVADL